MGSLVFLLTMILFKVTLGQFCIASEFDASPTAFFTTSVTVKVLDSFSSPLSGVTISISSTFISPADSSILSGTSGADGNVVFSIFYTNIGLLTISLNCISFATGTLDVTPVIPALAFGSDTLVSSM